MYINYVYQSVGARLVYFQFWLIENVWHIMKRELQLIPCLIEGWGEICLLNMN